MAHDIEVGFQTFLVDGGEEFGAVRDVRPNGDLLVYVENAGDFVLTADSITAVHSKKVIVDVKKLPAEVRKAIGHAHDAETL